MPEFSARKAIRTRLEPKNGHLSRICLVFRPASCPDLVPCCVSTGVDVVGFGSIGRFRPPDPAFMATTGSDKSVKLVCGSC